MPPVGLSSPRELQMSATDSSAKLHADFWVGGFFAVIGIIVTEQGAALRQGTAASMGPGFVPLWLGICLIVVGALIALLALRKQEADAEAAGNTIDMSALQPIVMTTAALLAFSLTLDSWGLFLASGLLVAVARLDSWKGRPLEIVALSCGLAVANIAIFFWGLGVPVPLWPSSLLPNSIWPA